MAANSAGSVERSETHEYNASYSRVHAHSGWQLFNATNSFLLFRYVNGSHRCNPAGSKKVAQGSAKKADKREDFHYLAHVRMYYYFHTTSVFILLIMLFLAAVLTCAIVTVL